MPTKGLKYFIQIFGCQMNHSDAERARTVLAGLGYAPTETEAEANLIMVVACAVRQKAVDRIYGRNERWQIWKKERPLITVLTGCVLDADKQRLAKIFDCILPITDLARLPQLIEGATKHHVPAPPAPLDEYFGIPPSRLSSFQAFVPISTGCNKFCSYCAVPLTRGRELSRPPLEILHEVSDLVKKGYKEITLLGQNVNSYGWDFEGVTLNLPKQKVLKYFKDEQGTLKVRKRTVKNPMDFPRLLEAAAAIPGDFWIRFISSHPYDMSDDLIATIASYEKITPYIHLAVQSGSDAVLKRMNRLYTVAQYRERVQAIRQRIPDAVMSTDIIVGFCGETEQDFLATNELVQSVGYDMAFIAQYSPRPGNVAYDWADDVPKTDKIDRHTRLNVTLRTTALERNKKLKGTTQRVLVERTTDGYAYGKTYGFKNIKFPTASDLTGQFVQVNVDRVTAWSLFGTRAD